MANPRQVRAKVANTARWHPDNPEAIAAARAELAEANAEADIASWPPFSSATRERLARRVLSGSNGRSGDEAHIHVGGGDAT